MYNNLQIQSLADQKNSRSLNYPLEFSILLHGVFTVRDFSLECPLLHSGILSSPLRRVPLFILECSKPG